MLRATALVVGLTLAPTALADEIVTTDVEQEVGERPVDVLIDLDRVLERLANLIEVEGERVSIADGLLIVEGNRSTALWGWLVVDGEDLSVADGWLTVIEGAVSLNGWRLPL